MISKMAPKVSVIVPTIGRDSLRETIESVLNQSYKNIEIIVTDDTDKVKAYNIIKKYFSDELTSGKIIYVKNKKYKKGPSGNKNNGLDFVTGKYFLFVDDDDTLVPGSIELLVDVAESDGYEVIIANCMDSNGNLTGSFNCDNYDWRYEDCIKGNVDGDFLCFVSSNLIKNRRFYDDCWGGEHLLWWEIYKASNKNHYIDKVLKKVNSVSLDKVTFKMEKHPERQVLNYYYTILEFGDDLMKVNPKQYLRYLIRGMYFSKLAKDKEKLIFFKIHNNKLTNIKLKFVGLFWYFVCNIMPASMLVFLNKILYQTVVSFVKERLRQSK